MVRFRKILVPVDLTDKNAGAIAIARDLAAEAAGEVILLHVIEELDAPFDEMKDFYERIEETAAARLSDAADPLRRAGVPFVAEVSYGKRAPEIVRFAEEREVDLIVLTSHRLDPVAPNRSLMTISHQVAIAAVTPVLLIR